MDEPSEITDPRADLKASLEHMAAEAQAASAAIDAVLPPDEITRRGDHKAREYMQALLDSGVDPKAAVDLAMAEGTRHELFLKALAADFANPRAQIVSLWCANEQKHTDHVVLPDRNHELVATCLCGNFKKFADAAALQAAEQADAAPPTAQS